MADFIRLYTTRYKRWASPKFLIGESYGTTRAAGLSGHLEGRYGLYLNGIALISSVLDFSTISFNDGNDLPYILYLPSETAAAWYHKKLPPDLQTDLKKALAESEHFARAITPRRLCKVRPCPPPNARRWSKTRAADRFVRGLRGPRRPAYSRPSIFKELLRSERKTIGRFDSRVTGVDRDAVGDSPDYDPSYTAVLGPYTAAVNDYVRRELKFESDLPYEILTGKVSPWNYGSARNRYLDVAETLREAMTHNPYLKVFVANGYYDLATPYLATRYHLRPHGSAR